MVSKLYVCGHVLFVMVRVMAVLTALGEGTEEIDMTRMKNILNQSIIKVLNVVSCCTSSFSCYCPRLFTVIVYLNHLSPCRLKKLLITSLHFQSSVISCLVRHPLM